MNFVFKDMLWKCALVYLGDMLIFTESPQKHVEVLKRVMKSLAEYVFKI